MNSNIKRIENSRAEIELTTAWSEIESKYNQLIDKYQKQLTIPGFRKGKAPKHVVENKIGKDILNDSAFEAMDETIRKAFKEIDNAELRPLPYSQPEVLNADKIIPIKAGENITFVTRYDVMPEIKLTKYKDLEVEYPNVVISDDMVKAEIERYREQNAEIKSKDDGVVESGDLVTIDYSNLDLETDNKTVNDYTFTIGNNQNYYKFDDQIIGMKAGEEKTFKMTYSNEDKPEGLNRNEANFTVKVKSIKSKTLPKVDDEFAQDIKSEYKTVDDMKNGIKNSLSKDLDTRMKDTKIDLIAQKILEENEDFYVPKSMIDFEVNNTFNRFASQMGMKPNDLEKFLESQGQNKEQFTSSWRTSAENNIKKQLIIGKIGEVENLQADSEKLEAAKKSQIPETATQEQREQYETIIKDNLEYEAALEFLLANSKLSPSKKEISYEDFASGEYLKKNSEEK